MIEISDICEHIELLQKVLNDALRQAQTKRERKIVQNVLDWCAGMLIIIDTYSEPSDAESPR
jgi:hypothetical protein